MAPHDWTNVRSFGPPNRGFMTVHCSRRLSFCIMFAFPLPATLAAQSLADSVQIIAAAVRGYDSPNGSLVRINAGVTCISFVERGCPPRGTMMHSPALMSALADELKLEIAKDSATALLCPWETGNNAAHGMTLDLGILRVRGDTASVYVGRGCSMVVPRPFAEGGVVVLRRTDGKWVVKEILSRWIT
jgi:hypothetical protein